MASHLRNVAVAAPMFLVTLLLAASLSISPVSADSPLVVAPAKFSAGKSAGVLVQGTGNVKVQLVSSAKSVVASATAAGAADSEVVSLDVPAARLPHGTTRYGCF